ncbi:hypothetical protein LEP1GSC040_0911 [Leptospira santarosai str. 2000030832]|nr:hypothetical protein LEP1GSC040_0911 [Leptospira santarosai str. 2000030832]
MNFISGCFLNKKDAFKKEELRREHISSLRISGFQIKAQKRRNRLQKREKRIF